MILGQVLWTFEPNFSPYDCWRTPECCLRPLLIKIYEGIYEVLRVFWRERFIHLKTILTALFCINEISKELCDDDDEIYFEITSISN